MIRINLLPHKKVKPVEKGILRLRALIIAVTVLLAIGLGVWYYLLASAISDLTEKNDQTTKQLEALKSKIKEVAGYELRRAEYEKKLNIINELQKKKVPLTPFLGELNRLMIKEVWLTNLTLTDGSFTIDAMAKEDRKYIDEFVGKLDGSHLLTKVTLVESKEVPSNSPGVRAFSFKVKGTLAGFEKKEQPAAQGKT